MTDAAESRPVLSITEAADATGKSRRTIGRLLDAGRLEGAERDDADGWRIPVEALLAAGLTLHAPSPPDAPTSPPNVALLAPIKEPALDAAAELRAELENWRRRAEVAEAIAAEREKALDDVRTALDLANRMLTAGPTPSTPPTSSTVEPERRRWWRR